MGEGANRVVTVIQNLLAAAGGKGYQLCKPAVVYCRSDRLGRDLSKFINLHHETDRAYFDRMLWVPLSAVAGAATYYTLLVEPPLWTYAVLICLVGLSGWWLRQHKFTKQGIAGFIWLLCAFAILGFCYSGFRTHTMGSAPLKAPVDRVMVEGWLEEVSGTGERTRYLIDVQAVSGLPPEVTPKNVRMTLRSARELEAGRFIRCYGSLRPPPAAMLPGDYNFARQAYFEKLDAVGFVFGSCKPGRLSAKQDVVGAFIASVNAKRRALAQNIFTSQGETRGSGLAAALLTGDRSFLTPQDQDNLQGSGLAHLLAISGLHMGLAAGVFYIALFRLFALIEPLAIRFPVQKLAQAGALIAITGYLVFSGASISTQRAYVMLSVALCFGLFDRPVVSFQALTFAMFVVLLLSPWAVVTPGYQMSFAATAALIAVYRAKVRQPQDMFSGGMIGRARRFLSALVITSWVAGLATLPFALYHFDRAAPLGFLANLVVMPIVSLVCVPLAALTAVTLPLGLGAFSLGALSEALGWILDLAQFFSRDASDWSPFSFQSLPMLSLLMSIGALCLWVIHTKPMRLPAYGLAGLAVLAWGLVREPVLIFDGAGHVFIRNNINWTEVRTGSRGLKPLRFSDIESMDCASGCTFADQRLVVTESTDDSIKITDLAGRALSTLGLSDHERVYGYANLKSELKIVRRPDKTCRPWSRTWPLCV